MLLCWFCPAGGYGMGLQPDFTGRAALLASGGFHRLDHGTAMCFSRSLPNQRYRRPDLMAGRKPDAKYADRQALRSTHNKLSDPSRLCP